MNRAIISHEQECFWLLKNHVLLHNKGIIVSEKVIRRIMKQEQLLAKQKRTKNITLIQVK